MHHRELAKTTNTGRLALLALTKSDLKIRGDRTKPFSARDLIIDDYQSILLMPTSDAVELTPALCAGWNKPIHLIVPDGNWSQARKAATREPDLAGIPRVKLGSGEPSKYRLRQAPRLGDLSTFEAISRALGVIEGPALEETLQSLFDLMIERVLWSRGRIPASDCKTPIPASALEAFHRDGCAGSLKRSPVRS